MLTNPGTRKRYGNVTPGLAALPWGQHDPSLTPEVIEQMSALMGVYRFTQGDIFLPGPAAFAMDPSHETPLATVWGHAFLVRANAFRPLSAIGQIAMTGTVQPVVGVGGPIAGQMMFQPLQVRQADGG